jgi:hypothetical protein
VVPWLGLGAAALLALAWRRGAGPRSTRVPREYARALTLLQRRGLVRAPTTAAREFARIVHEHVPADAGGAFDALTEGYLAQRFGGRPPHSRAAGQLATLRQALRSRGASAGF